jgi:hypothetical protein
MINAKEELLEILKRVNQMYGANVLCASIDFDGKLIELNQGYIEEEFDFFLSRLDFEYHNGYGAQGLFGKVWLTNGVWLDRGEYDGSEWWEYYKYPELPADVIINESLKNLNL